MSRSARSQSSSARGVFGALALMIAAVAFAAPPVVSATPDWKVVVQPAPNIIGNIPTDMRVRITDAKGQPVTGASVEYVLNMIDMDHGEHKSAAKMVEPGLYEGKVNFFMIGPWSLEVRAKRGSDAIAQKMRFDIRK